MNNLVGRDLRIYQKLREAYPKNLVSGITKHEIYNEVRDRCKELNLPLEEYMSFLGFEYTRKSSHLNIEVLLEKISALFPDKILVGGLQDLNFKDNKLLQQLRHSSRLVGSNPKRILEENGYTVYSPQTKTNTQFLYDNTALKILKEEYNAKMVSFANWFGISKQAVDSKLKAKNESFPHWRNKDLTEDEKLLIEMMAEEGLYEYEDEDITVIFYQHKEQKKLAIFIIYIHQKEIKCFFDIPPEIDSLLKMHRYDKFTKHDAEILKYISQNNFSYINMFEEREIRYVVHEHTGFDTKVRRSLKAHGFTDKKDYFTFLGFKYVTSTEVTDDDIREKLKEFLVTGTNRIRIPIDHPKYQYFMRIASSRGLPFRELVQHVGYEYTRTRTMNTKEKYISILREHYMVDDESVYIYSLDPVYIGLTAYAYKYGKTITEQLTEWGFKRLMKEDLPAGFVPYHFSEHNSYELNTEDEFIRLLEDVVIEDNKIYLQPDEVIYKELCRWAILHDTSINALLNNWGFDRIYFQDLPDLVKREIPIKSGLEESFRNTLLNRISEVQGNLALSNSENEKRERSQSLSQNIKKLYEYRCQLCSEEEGAIQLPLIEKDDGTLYVEVHHIVPVSSADIVQDDTFIALIDSYKNVVVVCAHHHRQLHFHNGGYQKLIYKDDGKLYFVSRNGDLLKVYTNYHLVPTEELFQHTWVQMA